MDPLNIPVKMTKKKMRALARKLKKGELKDVPIKNVPIKNVPIKNVPEELPEKKMPGEEMPEEKVPIEGEKLEKEELEKEELEKERLEKERLEKEEHKIEEELIGDTELHEYFMKTNDEFNSLKNKLRNLITEHDKFEEKWTPLQNKFLEIKNLYKEALKYQEDNAYVIDLIPNFHFNENDVNEKIQEYNDNKKKFEEIVENTEILEKKTNLIIEDVKKKPINYSIMYEEKTIETIFLKYKF